MKDVIRTSGAKKSQRGPKAKESPKKQGFECQICFVVSPTQTDYINHILEAHKSPIASPEPAEPDEPVLVRANVKLVKAVQFEETGEDELVQTEEEEVLFHAEEEAEQEEQEGVAEQPLIQNEEFIVTEVADSVATAQEDANEEEEIILLPVKVRQPKERRSYRCDRCSKVFMTHAHLRLHFETNCGQEKKFKCDICNAKFISKPILKTHLLIHTKERNFKCEYCGKSFLSAGQLKVHLRVHTKEQPFECNVCYKKFAYRESLVTHSVQHTGVKPYECLCCRQGFSCVGNLIKHRNLRLNTCGRPEFCQNTRVAPRATTKMVQEQQEPQKRERRRKRPVATLEPDDDDDEGDASPITAEAEQIPVAEMLEVEPRASKRLKIAEEAVNKSTASTTTAEYVASFNVAEEEDVKKYDEYVVVDLNAIQEVEEEEEESHIIKEEIDHLINNDLVMQTAAVEEVDDEHCVTYKIEYEEDPDDDQVVEVQKFRRKPQPKGAMYQCKFCPKWYYDVEKRDQHQVVHGVNGDLMVKCAVCPMHFRTEEMALAHRANSHVDRVECKACHQMVLASAMPDHLVERHAAGERTGAKKDLTCRRCQKEFSTVRALQKHRQSDCSETPSHQCDICKKCYASAGTLKIHRSFHTKEKPFECGVCQKRLRTQMQLNVHQRVHTGERPYKCNQCEKAYAHRESLITHQSSHTGFKRFMCLACGNRFSCISNLQSHRRGRQDTCGKMPAYTKPVGMDVDVAQLRTQK